MAVQMAGQPVVQVSRFLDERGLSAFHIKLIIWSLFIVFIDGYDIGAIAFAAPELIKTWHVKPAELGPVFSASLVGVLFGSALFGFIGDRYGRRAALIGSMLLFGVVTLPGDFPAVCLTCERTSGAPIADSIPRPMTLTTSRRVNDIRSASQ